MVASREGFPVQAYEATAANDTSPSIMTTHYKAHFHHISKKHRDVMSISHNRVYGQGPLNYKFGYKGPVNSRVKGLLVSSSSHMNLAGDRLQCTDIFFHHQHKLRSVEIRYLFSAFILAPKVPNIYYPH